MKPSETDILIVGAGLAGLCTARSLLQRGRDVLVLEARPRVGGRLFSLPLEGAISADLGAQWHGPGQKRIIALASELGVESHATHTAGRASYQFMGRTGSYRGAGPARELLTLLGAGWGGVKLSRLSRHVERQTAWRAPLPELQQQSLGAWIDRQVWPKGGRQLLRFAFQSLFCCDPDEVSLLLALYCLAKCSSLEHLLSIQGGCQERQFTRGTQDLVERLSRDLESRILLQRPVRKIVQDELGALVSGDGFELRARRVVITIPPPLVADIELTPQLPSSRQRVLAQLALGSVVKCVVLYERPFWRDHGFSGEMWSDAGPLNGTYDTSVPSSPRGVLTGLATGAHAARLAAEDPARRRQLLLSGIAQHFGERATHPLEYRDQVWSNEAWTRGGYSAHVPAGEFTAAFCSRHEPTGVLHWAGTETAAAWPGYMEGAIESSERVVRELTEAR